VFNHLAQHLCDARVTHLHGADQGQGGFSLRQVVTDVLADILAGRAVVERIVDHLEGHAEVAPVIGQRLLFGLGAGILVVLLRLWGAWPEPIPFALMLMNLTTPLLDRIRPKPFGGSYSFFDETEGA